MGQIHRWLSNHLNKLRPRQNGRHFADDIFKCIFGNENVWISIKISLKFVRKGPINNIPALVQIMAWHRPGDKPLSEAMMIHLPTHICVSRPQWVNIQRSANRVPLHWHEHHASPITGSSTVCSTSRKTENSRYWLFVSVYPGVPLERVSYAESVLFLRNVPLLKFIWKMSSGKWWPFC